MSYMESGLIAGVTLLSRRALELLDDLPEHNRVFRITVPYVGLKTGMVEYERDRRYAGKTKYNLKSMIPYALDSVTSVSTEPLRKLRIPVYLSGILLLLSIAFGVVSQGQLWQVAALLMGTISLFHLMLSVCIAVIAEYVAQIFIEVKGRPVSMVEQYSPPQKGETT